MLSQQFRNWVRVLLRPVRALFGQDLADPPKPADNIREWFFEPANNLTHNVALATGGPPASAPGGEERHELVVAMTALLGVTSRETLEWIVTRMLVSRDPAMHSLARALRAMWNPDKKDRALDRDLQLACLFHIEVLNLRAGGMEEDNIRDRAADIVLDRLKGMSPDKTRQVRTRLMEIYRDNEVRVQVIWLDMEAFGFTASAT